MKVKSISGFRLEVSDLARSQAFYEKLGFRWGKQAEGRLTGYINWFSVDFVACQGKVVPGQTIFINMAVEDVDETHKELTAMKLQPTEVVESPFGRRETQITDPDGYNLVFFTK